MSDLTLSLYVLLPWPYTTWLRTPASTVHHKTLVSTPRLVEVTSQGLYHHRFVRLYFRYFSFRHPPPTRDVLVVSCLDSSSVHIRDLYVYYNNKEILFRVRGRLPLEPILVFVSFSTLVTRGNHRTSPGNLNRTSMCFGNFLKFVSLVVMLNTKPT